MGVATYDFIKERNVYFFPPKRHISKRICKAIIFAGYFIKTQSKIKLLFFFTS